MTKQAEIQKKLLRHKLDCEVVFLTADNVGRVVAPCEGDTSLHTVQRWAKLLGADPKKVKLRANGFTSYGDQYSERVVTSLTVVFEEVDLTPWMTTP